MSSQPPVTMGGFGEKIAEAFLLPPLFLKKRKKRKLQPALGDDAVKEGQSLRSAEALLDQHAARVAQFVAKHAAARR